LRMKPCLVRCSMLPSTVPSEREPGQRIGSRHFPQEITCQHRGGFVLSAHTLAVARGWMDRSDATVRNLGCCASSATAASAIVPRQPAARIPTATSPSPMLARAYGVRSSR
jgi:hypothetical protein